jgi:hypothetical protein
MTTKKKTSTGEKIFALSLLPFVETGIFILFWNILRVHSAVGHHLGTVNFWTALGVDIVVAGIVSAVFATPFWGAKYNVGKLYDTLDI